MIHVGITGGIGAGKTAALRLFGTFGARVLDADDIVHRLYAPGSELCALLSERWGTKVTNSAGGIDRAAVADIVFAAADELEWLNQTIHPRVRQKIQEERRRPGPPLFCAVPLLYESGWERDWDRVAAVWCDPATQRERLRRRGWSDRQIARRLERQLTERTITFFSNPDKFRIDPDKNTVRLSPVMDWYKDDFGKNQQDRLDFIKPFIQDADARAFLSRDKLKIENLDYDWGINDQMR